MGSRRPMCQIWHKRLSRGQISLKFPWTFSQPQSCFEPLKNFKMCHLLNSTTNFEQLLIYNSVFSSKTSRKFGYFPRHHFTSFYIFLTPSPRKKSFLKQLLNTKRVEIQNFRNYNTIKSIIFWKKIHKIIISSTMMLLYWQYLHKIHEV